MWPATCKFTKMLFSIQTVLVLTFLINWRKIELDILAQFCKNRAFRNSKKLKTKIFFQHLQSPYKNKVPCVIGTAHWSALKVCCLMTDSIFCYSYFVLTKQLSIVISEEKTKPKVLITKYFSTYLKISS